jgi:hypothetical protein
MRHMSNSEKLDEFICYVLVGVFALGWMDFGQGTEYTWWNLINYFGN